MKKTAIVLLVFIFASLSITSCQKAKEIEGKKEAEIQKQEAQARREEVRPKQPTTISETKEVKMSEGPKESKLKEEFLQSLKFMQIAYIADGDVWVMRGDGSDKKKITNRGDVTILFGWSYDDTRLLFGTGKLDFDPIGNIISGFRLWILKVKTKKMILVMNGEQILKAEWSPKEATFFVAKLDEGLWLLNENATDAKKIIYPPVGSPRWSPNGEKIAYEVSPPVVGDADPEEPPLGWSHIWILDVKTGAKKQITKSGRNGIPFWVTDDHLLFFTSTGERGEGDWWMYSIKEKNKDKIIVKNVKNSNNEKAFLKGNKVPTFSEALWSIALGEKLVMRRVVEEVKDFSVVDWSWDFKYIVYVSKKNGIWVGSLDLKDKIKVVDYGNYPYWSKKEAGK